MLASSAPCSDSAGSTPSRSRFQLPLPLSVKRIAERAVGHVRASGGRVDQDGLRRLRALGLDAEVGGGDELVGHPGAVLLAQPDQDTAGRCTA